jgi:hypothetical protein
VIQVLVTQPIIIWQIHASSLYKPSRLKEKRRGEREKKRSKKTLAIERERDTLAITRKERRDQ